jgi:integrase
MATVTIYKAKGRNQYACQYTDPVTGKRCTRSAGTANRREAERFAAKLEDEIDRGDHINLNLSWSDFRDRYETIGLSGKRKSSQREQMTTLNLFEQYINPARPQVITTAVVSGFAVKLRVERGCREATIRKHLSGLRAVLNWAKSQGYIKQVPKFTMPKCTGMKGRPITEEELERMIAAIPKVVSASTGNDVVEGYRRLLRGLWFSGLRISEAMRLSWDELAGVRVDLSGKLPMIDFAGQFQKNGKDQRIPITPDFFELLMSIPEADRAGAVFGLECTSLHASKVISKAGRLAGVITKQDQGRTVYASAHDLRRAFGNRWARRIPAHDLQLLMRHADIQTTLKFYVGQRSDDAGAVVWGAVNADRNEICRQSADNRENQQKSGQEKTPQTVVVHGVKKYTQ